MTDQRDALGALFAACWKDEALKERFKSDPMAVLAEYGLELPEGMAVKVVENDGESVHITVPPQPESHQPVLDEELGGVGKGSTRKLCSNPFTCQGCPD